MNRQFALWYLVVALSLALTSTVSSLPPEGRLAPLTASQTIDNSAYIDANKILMFVTNHGNFGRDLAGVFGNDYGTYYPYTSLDDIWSGVHKASVLYAGGLWLGGVDVAAGDTLVTVSEYSCEYVPGPMAGGTYQYDQPAFRVYKLYRDSLADNPNQDYLGWPVDQGAPVDGYGRPIMLGDQMTWTVCNDADPNQHNNNNGTTAPMGIEVQQTVWATDQDGNTEIPLGGAYMVSGPGVSPISVSAFCLDRLQVTGHDYMVVIDSTVEHGFCWHLIDVTTSQILLADQTDFSGAEVIVDGFSLTVRMASSFASFECIANGAGPLSPPEPAAAAFAGFPTPTGGYPTDNQQVGNGLWLVHTGDNGGTNGGGTRGLYDAFLERVLRGDPERISRLGACDFEMRFTGSYDNPGVGGGYAWAALGLGMPGDGFWVPFELWRTGNNTPDDPSDDLRLIPWVLGDITGTVTGDNYVFDLSQYGSALDGSCHDGCEHSVSGGDNDPYTDWVYWRLPEDQTPGDAGYQAFEAAMISDPSNWSGNELPIMDRTVLVNWNGGNEPPFNQDLPEEGTIFRIRTNKMVSGQAFTFRADQPQVLTTGPLGTSIYLKYKLMNKGEKTFENFFLSLWLDPDLGGSGDDLVGCDTLNSLFFCYNASNSDNLFSGPPPAVGFKIIEGPIVYTGSLADTALVDGQPLPSYQNRGMYSFNKYINGTDPDNFAQSYCYMKGLNAKDECTPYINPTTGQPTRFVCSGDPVTGTGWIDESPSDRRMMASFGPFTFRPGDSQQVVCKMAVGQNTDRLGSVTSMREVIGFESNYCCTGKVGDVNGANENLPSIGDVAVLIDAKYISGSCRWIQCLAEADINQSGGVQPNCDDLSIGDISTLIDYIFITGPSLGLPDCP